MSDNDKILILGDFIASVSKNTELVQVSLGSTKRGTYTGNGQFLALCTKTNLSLGTQFFLKETSKTTKCTTKPGTDFHFTKCYIWSTLLERRPSHKGDAQGRIPNGPPACPLQTDHWHVRCKRTTGMSAANPDFARVTFTWEKVDLLLSGNMKCVPEWKRDSNLQTHLRKAFIQSPSGYNLPSDFTNDSQISNLETIQKSSRIQLEEEKSLVWWRW